MAKLSFPTSRAVPGPLLIDAHQLQALDEITDRHAVALREHRDREIEASVEKDIQRRLARGFLSEEQVETQRERLKRFGLPTTSRLQRDSVSVALYLRGGREVQADRFSDAINQPIGEEEAPVGLGLYLTIGSVQAIIRLADVHWRQELTIEVEPNNTEVAQGLFGALNNWASDVQAAKWQQWWLGHRSYLVIALAFWMFFGFMFIPIMNWAKGGERASRIEARKMLSQGVNASNEQRAIELILAIESGYDAGGRGTLLGLCYWSYVVIGSLCLVCSVICPRVCIGVWKGRRQIKRWRSWLSTVTFTIPLLIAGSAVLPWVLHWLGLSPPSP